MLDKSAEEAGKDRLRHTDSSLSIPLSDLLESGGDSRLAVDHDSLLNMYGCRASPRSEVLAFASSTATSISESAYDKAESVRRVLLQSGGCSLSADLELRTELMRAELRTLLGIDKDPPEVVFSPSGTDSQLHSLAVASMQLGGDVTVILAAADQTGSGTPNAVLGRHFSDRTPKGIGVKKGARISGFNLELRILPLPLYDESGRIRSRDELDSTVTTAVGDSIRMGKNVILHVMDCSKLGWRYPGADLIESIRLTYGSRVQIVVDACQLRLSRARLKWYLEQDCMVVITGSKFFTGPPFCGALLVPARISAQISRARRVPNGLREYTNSIDWPRRWEAMRRSLPHGVNLGQFFRWVAALEEFRAYFAVPQAHRNTLLRIFAERVPAMIESCGCLQLLPDRPARGDQIPDDEMGDMTICSFVVRLHDRFMSMEQTRAVYDALNRPVAHLLPTSATAKDKWLASQLCHVGQPVRLRSDTGEARAALRISADARFVYDSWSPAAAIQSGGACERELQKVSTIIGKLALLQRMAWKVDFSK